MKNRKEKVLLREYMGSAVAIHKNNIDSQELRESLKRDTGVYLTEQEKREVKEKDALFLIGIVQAGDTKNGNGRIYPKPILEREVERFKNSVIGANGGYGESNHPDGEDIDINNISHRMVDLWWDGNNVMGKIKILHNRPGQDLRNLIQLDGMQPGISSRAIGSIHEDYNGNTIVEDDLTIICWDMVVTPSTPSAYMVMEKQGRYGSYIKESNECNSKKDKIKTLLEDIVRG